MRGYVPPVSFGALLGFLGILTVIGVGVAVIAHRPILIPIVLGAAIAVGIVYILFVRDRPEPEPPPAEASGPPSPETSIPPGAAQGATAAGEPSVPGIPGTASTSEGTPNPNDMEEDTHDDEPFYDPVEEADLLDSARPPSDTPPSGGDDPK